MGLKGLYDAKLVSIYIFGKAAEGDLKRPFAAGGMFGGEHRPGVFFFIEFSLLFVLDLTWLCALSLSFSTPSPGFYSCWSSSDGQGCHRGC